MLSVIKILLSKLGLGAGLHAVGTRARAAAVLTLTHPVLGVSHKLDLQTGTHTLRNTPDADIWLPYKDCSLVVKVNKHGLIEVFSLNGISPQNRIKLAGPSRRLSFSISNIAITAQSKIRRSYGLIQSVIVATLAIALVFLPISYDDYTSPRAAGGVISKATFELPVTPADFISTVNSKLTRIGSSLTAQIGRDGMVEISGSSTETDTKATRELVASLAQRAKPSLKLRDPAPVAAMTPSPVVAPKISFRSVSLAPQPVVFLKNGSSLHVGEVIDDWTVTRITDSFVEVSRGAVSVAITTR